MADDNTTDTTTGPANVPGGVMNLEPGTFPGKIVEGTPLSDGRDEPTVEPEHTSAAARLRAFEDEHFGEDAVRIGGKIERGSGSPFSEMSDEGRKKYEAIERLIVAEQKLADAHTALIQADADYEAAEAAVDG